VRYLTNRGYTGHEHLDAFGIINMNGRVYDPATGQFLSPDPVIQSPGDWVNYNRYSYCFGNPMRYTDPSGYQTNRNLGSDNGAAAYQNDQLAQWGLAWKNYYIMRDAISEAIKKWTTLANCYIQGPPQGNIPMASDAQGGTDMYGRNMYDNMGVYIPQYMQPGGAIPANYGNPGYGHWEGITTTYSSYSCYKDDNGNMHYSQATENGSRTRYEYVFDQGAGRNSSGFINWGLAALTVEDMYNNFLHNHTTYETTKGVVKDIFKANGAVRSERALQFARLSTAVKIAGDAGSLLTTLNAVNNINKGDGNAILNWSDASVGSAGLLNSSAGWIGSKLGLSSIPIVGEGVAIYSWARLWGDIGYNYGPSHWYGDDDTKWFK